MVTKITKLLSSILVLILLFILNKNQAFASNYVLDQDYGINGKSVSIFNDNSNAKVTSIQSDGKIITAGHTFNGSNFDWAIVRQNTNGSSDSSFGVNGKIVMNFGDYDSIGSLSIQPDGKFVVGGFTNSNGLPFNWTLARFNSDGTLDTNFGTGGLIVSGTMGVLNGLIITPDNKIIAVGYFLNVNGNDDVAIVKYNNDGSLDTSFGVSGKVITGIGGSNDRGNAAVLQPDGKIVVLGDFAAGNDDVFLARFHGNGTIDGSFGSGGKNIFGFNSNSGGRDLALQTDGKIVAVGNVVNSSSDSYIVRVNTNGTFAKHDF